MCVWRQSDCGTFRPMRVFFVVVVVAFNKKWTERATLPSRTDFNAVRTCVCSFSFPTSLSLISASLQNSRKTEWLCVMELLLLIVAHCFYGWQFAIIEIIFSVSVRCILLYRYNNLPVGCLERMTVAARSKRIVLGAIILFFFYSSMSKSAITNASAIVSTSLQ